MAIQYSFTTVSGFLPADASAAGFNDQGQIVGTYADGRGRPRLRLSEREIRNGRCHGIGMDNPDGHQQSRPDFRLHVQPWRRVGLCPGQRQPDRRAVPGRCDAGLRYQRIRAGHGFRRSRLRLQWRSRGGLSAVHRQSGRLPARFLSRGGPDGRFEAEQFRSCGRHLHQQRLQHPRIHLRHRQRQLRDARSAVRQPFPRPAIHQRCRHDRRQLYQRRLSHAGLRHRRQHVCQV